ncbi:MAG: Arc family DNA-binding protein [Alphaproteobacteria bacterium]|nr:Arc family DNA-binding protein [Alphaproteobacteria bacterium]
MSKRKAFALRINEDILNATHRWADDDLRSLNAQIEYILRDALVKSGRVKLTQKVVTEVEEISSQRKD